MLPWDTGLLIKLSTGAVDNLCGLRLAAVVPVVHLIRVKERLLALRARVRVGHTLAENVAY